MTLQNPSFFACALKSLSSSFLYALLNSDFINLKKGIGVYHVSFLPFLWFALLLMMKSRFWRFLTTILFSLHTSLIIIRESQTGHHTVLKSLIFVQKSHFSALFKFKIFYQIGFKNEIQYFAGFSKS